MQPSTNPGSSQAVAAEPSALGTNSVQAPASATASLTMDATLDQARPVGPSRRAAQLVGDVLLCCAAVAALSWSLLVLFD